MFSIRSGWFIIFPFIKSSRGLLKSAIVFVAFAESLTRKLPFSFFSKLYDTPACRNSNVIKTLFLEYVGGCVSFHYKRKKGGTKERPMMVHTHAQHDSHTPHCINNIQGWPLKKKHQPGKNTMARTSAVIGSPM